MSPLDAIEYGVIDHVRVFPLRHGNPPHPFSVTYIYICVCVCEHRVSWIAYRYILSKMGQTGMGGIDEKEDHTDKSAFHCGSEIVHSVS